MTDRHYTAKEVESFADGEGGDSHLLECARCANAVLETVQMKRAVRAAMSTGAAPSALRSRLIRQGSHRFTIAPWWISIAAILAAVVVFSGFLLRARSQAALPEFVDMHVTLLAGSNPVDVISTDRHTVKPWFEGRVPFAVPVPDLSATPFRLLGGRVVYWHGRQAAYLLVGKGAHRISLFVLRQEDAPESLGPPPPAVSTTSWSSDGLTFVAVADLPQPDLDQLRAAFQRR